MFLLRCMLLNRRRLDAGSAARDPSLSLTHDALKECVDGTGLASDASRGVVTVRVEVDASSSHFSSCLSCIGTVCARGWLG